MKQPASIFNDVLGPVMVGPSSSHTAASVRIGYMLRQLCREQPRQVVFYFSRQGSLAACHEGQGTDMGLAAGLLGLAMDDSRIPQAGDAARQAGLKIEYVLTDEPVDHPNTYRVETQGGGRALTAEFISTGGGMIELRRINNIEVNICGGYHETLFLLGHCSAEAAETARLQLARGLPFYEHLLLCAGDKGGYLLDVKTTAPLSPEQTALVTAAADVLQLKPVLPIQARRNYQGLINSAQEVLNIAEVDNLKLWQVAALYEARRGHIGEDDVFERMRSLLHVMRRAITLAEQQPVYADRILGPQAQMLKGTASFPNPTLNAVIQRITLLMEAKSALIPIVAAPTAGSCGALPGAVIGAAESLGLGEDDIVKALLAAAMVGILIAEHATFAAEVGGCQAECGAGSGMAAAALVQLLGGSAKQALDAASLALQNVFGLVCDPVAARVEIPCLGRNIMAGANALAMAQLALAGFDAVIPLDEVIAAMHKVGQSIDSSLRCTCGGGLSQTPTSKEIEKRLAENKL